MLPDIWSNSLCNWSASSLGDLPCLALSTQVVYVKLQQTYRAGLLEAIVALGL